MTFPSKPLSVSSGVVNKEFQETKTPPITTESLVHDLLELGGRPADRKSLVKNGKSVEQTQIDEKIKSLTKEIIEELKAGGPQYLTDVFLNLEHARNCRVRKAAAAAYLEIMRQLNDEDQKKLNEKEKKFNEEQKKLNDHRDGIIDAYGIYLRKDDPVAEKITIIDLEQEDLNDPNDNSGPSNQVQHDGGNQIKSPQRKNKDINVSGLNTGHDGERNDLSGVLPENEVLFNKILPKMDERKLLELMAPQFLNIPEEKSNENTERKQGIKNGGDNISFNNQQKDKSEEETNEKVKQKNDHQENGDDFESKIQQLNESVSNKNLPEDLLKGIVNFKRKRPKNESVKKKVPQNKLISKCGSESSKSLISELDEQSNPKSNRVPTKRGDDNRFSSTQPNPEMNGNKGQGTGNHEENCEDDQFELENKKVDEQINVHGDLTTERMEDEERSRRTEVESKGITIGEEDALIESYETAYGEEALVNVYRISQKVSYRQDYILSDLEETVKMLASFSKVPNQERITSVQKVSKVVLTSRFILENPEIKLYLIGYAGRVIVLDPAPRTGANPVLDYIYKKFIEPPVVKKKEDQVELKYYQLYPNEIDVEKDLIGAVFEIGCNKENGSEKTYRSRTLVIPKVQMPKESPPIKLLPSNNGLHGSLLYRWLYEEVNQDILNRASKDGPSIFLEEYRKWWIEKILNSEDGGRNWLETTKSEARALMIPDNSQLSD